MVVVATNQNKHQNLGFDEKDFEDTKRVLSTALKAAIEKEVIECPPVEYIGLNDSSEQTLRKIQGAKVLKEGAITLEIKPPPDQESDFVVVTYGEVKCHPSIVPKYSVSERILGGACHMLTLGVGIAVTYATGYPTWPGFTNSDEKCAQCEQPPDTEGCTVTKEPVVEEFTDLC